MPHFVVFDLFLHCLLMYPFMACLSRMDFTLCHLITFANSLDPDQAKHNVGLDQWIQTSWHSDGIPEIMF